MQSEGDVCGGMSGSGKGELMNLERNYQIDMNLQSYKEELPFVLNEWCKLAYRISASKGWHTEDGQRHRFPERCMLIVTEIVELFEGARKGSLHDPCDKPIPLSKGAEEAADIFIRLCDFCKEFNIDLEYAVRMKCAYNETREHMHGGKNF